MPRRQQVEYRPPTAELQPVAAPQSRPFVPRLGPETILPVAEFAGLSKTLAAISVQQAERQAESDRVAGWNEDQTAPLDPVDAVAEASSEQDAAEGAVKANQKEFARAEQAGKILPGQNPWKTVGHVESSAHRLMMGYSAKLDAAMAQATATSDANGDPVLPQDLDKVVAGVWKEYADNPVLKNYYGAKVARQMKTAADAQFVERASAQRADNQVRDTVHWQTNALADKLFAQSVSGEKPTDETWATVKAWAADLYAKTGGQAKTNKVMMAAANGMASRIDAADGGESGVSRAAQALRNLRDAPAGGTTLGRDAETGPQLENLIADYDRAFEAKQGTEARTKKNAQASAILTAEQEVYTAIDKARASGAPVDIVQIANEYSAKIRAESGDPQANKFGDLTGVVVDAVQKLALDATQQQGQIDGSRLMQELDSGADPDAVAYTARMARSQLGLTAYRAILKEVEARKAVRPLIEESPVSASWDKTLADAAEIPGVPPSQRAEVGLDVQEENRAALQAFNSRRVAAMKAVANLPEEQREEAQRKWGDENVPELAKALRANAVKFSTEKEQATAEIQNLLDTHQDVAAALTKYRSRFSSDEAAAIRARGKAALDMEPLTLTPAYAKGEEFLKNEIARQYQKDDDVGLLVETGVRSMHDMFVERVGTNLVGADPAKVNSVIHSTVRELTDDVLQEVAAKKLARFQEAAAPGGETVPEAKALLDFANADRSAAQTALQDPEKAPEELTRAPSAHVSEELLELQRGFYGGDRKFTIQSGAGTPFGRVQSSHLLDRAYVDTKALLDDPGVDDATRGQAAVDMRRGTVVPAEEVLAGTMTVASSPNWRQRMADYANRLVFMPDPFHARQYTLIKEELDRAPRTVDISKAQIPPYTTAFFRSDAELKDWADNREGDLKALAKRVGVLDLPSFINFQRQAIRRANQE